MIVIRKNIRLLFVLVLPVYLFIVQSTIQNKHTHFFSNGIVITHAHPVDREKGAHNSDHRHTETEICLFQQLNFDYFQPPPPLAINPVNSVYIHKINGQKCEYYRHILTFQPLKRGPPHNSFL